MRAYPPPKFRVSSISGSRVSRGQNMPPPPGRVIIRPSPGDVLKQTRETEYKIRHIFCESFLLFAISKTITFIKCLIKINHNCFHLLFQRRLEEVCGDLGRSLEEPRGGWMSHGNSLLAPEELGGG